MPSISLPTFIGRWKAYAGSERAGAQEHFTDLCRLLDQPTPAEEDPTGESHAFEKGGSKAGGGAGFADVWKKDRFAWECKAKGGNLDEAYRQLLLYSGSLGNPPLLVICDFDRFKIYTNFNGIPTSCYQFTLSDLSDSLPLPEIDLPPLELLRALFEEPYRLKPGRTSARVTEEAAAQFANWMAAIESTIRGNDFATFRAQQRIPVVGRDQIDIGGPLTRACRCSETCPSEHGHGCGM